MHHLFSPNMYQLFSARMYHPGGMGKVLSRRKGSGKIISSPKRDGNGASEQRLLLPAAVLVFI
jgi:hypothetical protein